MFIVILVFFLFVETKPENASADYREMSGSSCGSNQPSKDEEETEDGAYLGTFPYSRLIYKFKEQDFNSMEISIDLKTKQSDGIVFYVAGFKRKNFFGLYLSNKKLFFSYNCDESKFSYSLISVTISDGLWHSVQVSSNDNLTKLTIDDTLYTGSAHGCRKRDLVSPFYFGSVDSAIFEGVGLQLEGQNKSFIGCLKNIIINGNRISQMSELVGVVPCRKNVEPATFFYGNGSYLIIHEHFRVGNKFEIEMKIKPKTSSGVLAAVYSNKDFAILLMDKGNFRFIVNNGNGAEKVEINVSDLSQSCDEKWLTVVAIKWKNVILLSVNGKLSEPVLDLGDNRSTDTYSSLYIAGGPEDMPRSEGVNYRGSYSGCIQELRINGKEIDFTKYKRVGQVDVNMCHIG